MNIIDVLKKECLHLVNLGFQFSVSSNGNYEYGIDYDSAISRLNENKFGNLEILIKCSETDDDLFVSSVSLLFDSFGLFDVKIYKESFLIDRLLANTLLYSDTHFKFNDDLLPTREIIDLCLSL